LRRRGVLPRAGVQSDPLDLDHLSVRTGAATPPADSALVVDLVRGRAEFVMVGTVSAALRGAA
jgi:hypothetical protein